MNKRQLLILGVGVLLLGWIIISAPKYYNVPSKGKFIWSEGATFYGRQYQPNIDWDWVWQRSLLVILGVGFLVFLVRVKNSAEVTRVEKREVEPPKIIPPRKKEVGRGAGLLITGWIFLIFQLPISYGIFTGNTGIPVLNWQEYPVRCFAIFLGEFIGSHVFLLVAFFAGLQVWKRNKNLNGRILFYCSLAMMCLLFMTGLLLSLR